MTPRTNGVTRARRSKSFEGERPNWILIAGGALLSTLSIRLGYKLKQVLDTKQPENANNGLHGYGDCFNANNGLQCCILLLLLTFRVVDFAGVRKSTSRKNSGDCHLHTDVYCFTQDENGCFNCLSGTERMVDTKQQSNGELLGEPEIGLPLVTVSAPEYTKENGVIWASSPDRLELPQKPFHHSNSSDSPCVSESGSDIFSKREVIQKLRQQLKRRDDMILEMQDQIVELQSSLSNQLSNSTHLQSMLDAANRDLFDSEREIQRLRKAIADHCVGQGGPIEKSSTVSVWPSEARNGHTNGYIDVESNSDFSDKGRGEGDRIEMLRREVGELKEVIEGKEYLLQNYKEQKSELSMRVKELQQRLDSQLPNIL
ncbi:hypothetical protein RJ639_043588 [Escallonia herrerae]|uniref:Uncharacterized protein n=1 Tax=Escallonia herrerae TaxID=1293975 RepID=A0AA89B0Z8_9ASTE|nr:hypothetical protein RJ639_043588 [Escallonia herrerae]